MLNVFFMLGNLAKSLEFGLLFSLNFSSCIISEGEITPHGNFARKFFVVVMKMDLTMYFFIFHNLAKFLEFPQSLVL